MKVDCIGSDPAGLYFGILLKRRNQSHSVRIIASDDTDAALPSTLACNPLKPRLKLADPEVHSAATAALASFDKIDVDVDSRTFSSRGITYATLRTRRLVDLLKHIALQAGCEFADAQRDDADLIVANDGPASRVRGATQGFETETTTGKNRLLAFESGKLRDCLTYRFRSTPKGVICATTWPTIAGSAVLVEAPAELSWTDSRALFPDEFDAASPAETRWQSLVTVRNRRWFSGKIVLLGQAAYTSHWSVGLDVRSGLEDAEALADCVTSHASIDEALKAFDAARRPKAESLQRAAHASQSWFELVDRHMRKPFEQFVFSLLTSSMRITYARIEKAAPELVRSVDALVAPEANGANRPPPPMFAPITLRALTIPNRVVVSPMCMYSSKDGTVNDFQLVHLGSRAVGGAGLVVTEMTDVLPEGRISLHCAGMYKPEHVDAWRRIVDFIHAHSGAKVAIQLAHAGRKGSLTRNWEGHQNLGAANWELLAPSPIPFMEGRQTPRAATRADMDQVRDAFVRAAEMSEAAGFDMIEMHYAHGYLMSSFISPAANRRTDEYGGSLENRMRFPLEVFRAVRAVWPKDKPMATRISAIDWVDGGNTMEDALGVARMLHNAGNDILAVSSGGVSSAQRAPDARAFQAVFSDEIRNTLKIPTMAVGGIVSHGDINTIIAAGRADMCALARGYLEDAYFARHAAREQGYDGLPWPKQYRRAGEVRLRGA
jgi:anthraniloyl-CoA monooxygenase